MTIINDFVKCEINCYSSKMKDTCDIETSEWLPSLVSLYDIQNVKSSGDGDGNDEIVNKAIIYYTNGECIVTNIDYYEFETDFLNWLNDKEI